MSDTPKDAKAIFLAALEIPDAAEQAAFVAQACGDDAALRQRVDDLLRAYRESDGPLDKLPAGLAATKLAEPAREQPGTVIGRYKLIELIGEGAMGSVWMAQQTEPVKRLVAIKLIKAGADSKTVLTRFEAERQALALMDHPNIAKVFDGGVTPSGGPYFAMELVKGVPITRYCDERKLTPSERLALFVPVCRAVQHAHQKGVIHRDLKPTNVLVAQYDGRPVPKVIDFGVAKAVGQPLTEKTLVTGFGAIVGTPAYMSPEQAELNQLDIDTRSDIYALGVLLYEILTGSTPFTKEQLDKAGLLEILRVIREQDPPRPSTKLSTADALPTIAANRSTEPKTLTGILRSELDWIVMKALEKDRNRRYETANSFAADIERYLAGEAVQAHPPTAAYRLRKFTGKYKKGLATAAAFVVLLAAGAVTSAILAVRATRAERDANRQRIASDESRQAALHAEEEALNAKAEADKQRDEARQTAYAAGMQLAQRAWEENDVVRARELLEELPKEAAGRKLRGFEWYYLSRLCHSEALTLEGHSRQVNSVAFSPDGERLASASGDKTVKIWSIATGKEVRSLKGHASFVNCVAFSPDGRRLASGSGDNTVKIWDSATGAELFSLKVHGRTVTSVAFSPDGKRLGSGSFVPLTPGSYGRRAPESDDPTINLWDSATGKELLCLKGHSLNVESLAFSPDGKRLASGSGDVSGTVKIWDSATGKELSSFKGHTNSVQSLAFSPDGKRLASGSYDQTLKIWDSATSKELFDLKGHLGPVMSVAFSPDGKWLASAGRDDRTIRIWDAATAKELVTLRSPYGVTSVAFSPDGQRVASGSYDQTVKIWDVATDIEHFDLKGTFPSHICSLAFSPDGRRLASSAYPVKIVDIVTGEKLFSSKGLMCPSVAFSPDGRRLASGSFGGTVKIADSATGKELLSLNGHSRSVASVAFSPDGQCLASGSFDHTTKIWDCATGKARFDLKGHTDPVTSVAFSPDGRRLASGSFDHTTKIWDCATGKQLLTLEGHAGMYNSVAFSPDGRRVASGSYDQSLKIWDSTTGKALMSLKGHARGFNCVAFSPDGQRLATGSSDNTVKIWDSATGKELFSFKADSNSVCCVAFSPDGQRLASIDQDGSIHLWEASVAPEIHQCRATTQIVANLFGCLLMRADVLERLRELPRVSPSRRQEAITLAQRYPEDPGALSERAWELAVVPGRDMASYRRALRYSEEACQLEPQNGLSLNTLGVAYYRVGNYEQALATLLRSDEINKPQLQGSIPGDLAFLAMTQQQLGHAKEAQEELQRFHERLKDPRWAKDAEAQGFLREAESLLAKPKMPGGKAR